MSPESDSKREVDARRRRRTDPPAGQERKQAPAPQRRRSRSGQQPASTGTGTNLSGSPGGKKLPGWAAVLILIVFVLFYIFSSSGGDGSSEPVSDLPGGQNNLPDTSLNAPQPTSPPFELPAAMPDAPVWLVMLYQDADDKILEQDILLDFNEAERIGSSPNVHIVSQLDRFNGGYQGDGDWRTTKRFYITQDLDLSRIGSEELADLGEVNMADGDTLVDFVTWAVQNFPADKYVLILSDHGMGWPGGWSDPAPGGRGDPDIPLAARLGDELYLMELDQALTDIRDQTGIEKFELIGMDACLMGHVEVFSALAPHARYAVASQETEPALGWAYTGFLEALIANPDMDGSELGEQIVSSYIDNDQRIVDDQARAEFLRQGSPMGSIFDLLLGGSPSTMDADQLAQQLGQGITLTAADLESLPELTASLNQFALALQNSDQSVIARARNYAQSFTSVFGREVPPSYIDLGNFVSLLLQESNDSELSRAGARLLQAIDQVVIAEKHGPKKPGATGLSIYFPNSSLFSNPIAGPDSYVAIANRFAEETLWDEFLAYHYTGNNFEAGSRGTTIPPAGTPVRAPGSGPIELTNFTISSQTASSAQPVSLSVDIAGDRIGYIYLLAGYYDPLANSIYLIDSDYLESAETRQVDGVYYPVWGSGDFTLRFTWEPVVFGISDGNQTAVARLKPESYGASYEQALYSVDGIYRFADGSADRYARLYFSDGILRQVFGFTGSEGTGAPREIIPQAGDQFTILEEWLDLDANGQVVGRASQEGATLTFGQQPFLWQALDAAAGNYMLGFIVEDLDGIPTEIYTQVSVE